VYTVVSNKYPILSFCWLNLEYHQKKKTGSKCEFEWARELHTNYVGKPYIVRNLTPFFVGPQHNTALSYNIRAKRAYFCGLCLSVKIISMARVCAPDDQTAEPYKGYSR